MELKELMTTFAEKLGIEGIEVKDGICSMTIDDIPMEFTESPDGLAVVGVAVIGEPPPEKREAFYEMLLEANTQVYGTQGIALSKLPDTGEIALIGGLPFKDLEIKEFCKCLDEFVSKAEEWRETVENFRPAAEEAAVRDEEEAQFRRFGHWLLATLVALATFAIAPRRGRSSPPTPTTPATRSRSSSGGWRWRTSAPPRKKPPSATRRRPSSPGSAGTAPASSASRLRS